MDGHPNSNDMPCFNPISIPEKEYYDKLGVYHYEEGRNVPCGSCVGCLSVKRNQWTFRLKQEMKVSDGSRFLTLTYNFENVKWIKQGLKYLPTLCKRDLQLYFKRVRKENDALRYFAVGEYGEKGRPHYHAIVFNVPDDLLIAKWSVKGQEMGFMRVNECNDATIHYVTKYVVNEFKNPEDGRSPVFAIMSKGLGSNYITPQMKKYHIENMQGMVTHYGGYKSAMPRYYKDKIFNEDQKVVIGVINNLNAQKCSKTHEEFLKEKEYLTEICRKTSKSNKF